MTNTRIKEISKEIIKDSIKREIGKRYPEGKVMETTVIKNNTSKLGISIKLPNIKITPVVYVDDMYDYYNNVNDLDDTLNKAISMIENSINSSEKTKLDDTVSNLIGDIKGNVFPRLVNTKTNEVMLKNTPHRDFLDMSIVYYIEQYNDELGAIEGIRITNGLMQSENLSEEELYHNSMKNMLEKEKSRLIPMIKVIMSIQFGIPLRETEISESDFSDGDFIMLSNERGINGSRRLLDTKALIKASEIAESDLYILPSSTQEVLIVSVNEINASVSELKNMVSEVNMNEVSKEERLTDNVYIFKRDTNTIEIA